MKLRQKKCLSIHGDFGNKSVEYFWRYLHFFYTEKRCHMWWRLCLAPEAAGDWLQLALNWANTILCRVGRIIFEAERGYPQRLEIQQARKGCLIDTHVLVPKVSCHSQMYTHTHTCTQQSFTRQLGRRLSNWAIPAVVKPAGLRLYESVTVEL